MEIKINDFKDKQEEENLNLILDSVANLNKRELQIALKTICEVRLNKLKDKEALK